jgi:4-hydroxy-tetrahydrodipicolinate synthase
MDVLFTGCITEIVTPFQAGKFDEASFRDLLEWQIESGIDGIVPAAAAGEGASLSPAEQRRVLQACVDCTAGRVPVLASTGSNSTAQAICLARDAFDLGADGHLVTVPYYNKPQQEGLFQHFAAIHDAIRMPMVIDNTPSRTATDLSLETLKRLCDLDFVVGIKEGSGDLARILVRRNTIDRDIIHLCGDDWLTIASIANGASGCISTLANIAPRACAEVAHACLSGDFSAARRIQDGLVGLLSEFSKDPTPATIKCALNLMRNYLDELRLPGLRLNEDERSRLAAKLGACVPIHA